MRKLKKLEKLKELSLPMVAEELRRMRNIQDVKAGGYGMTAGISAYVLYQIIQNANLNENYSSIDAMKLSKLSTRTTPAS